MTKKFNTSNPIIMKINRNERTIEIQWDRKPKNIEYILKNLKLFEIEYTPKIAEQIFSLPKSSSKNSNTDIIYI